MYSVAAGETEPSCEAAIRHAVPDENAPRRPLATTPAS